jgi:hypothetical protein
LLIDQGIVRAKCKKFLTFSPVPNRPRAPFTLLSSACWGLLWLKWLGIKLTALSLYNYEVKIDRAVPEGLHGVVLTNKTANLFLGAFK